MRPLKYPKISPWLTADLPLPLHIEGPARDWGWGQAWKPHPLLQYHHLVIVGRTLVVGWSLASIEDKWEESLIHHEAWDLQQL